MPTQHKDTRTMTSAAAAAGKKGPNVTMPEDVEMGKAFVATSEDNLEAIRSQQISKPKCWLITTISFENAIVCTLSNMLFEATKIPFSAALRVTPGWFSR